MAGLPWALGAGSAGSLVEKVGPDLKWSSARHFKPQVASGPRQGPPPFICVQADKGKRAPGGQSCWGGLFLTAPPPGLLGQHGTHGGQDKQELIPAHLASCAKY